MSFWHGVRGRRAMWVGTFEACDTFEMDMGQVPILVDQLDKMSDVIKWHDLAGIHGIGSGNFNLISTGPGWKFSSS